MKSYRSAMVRSQRLPVVITILIAMLVLFFGVGLSAGEIQAADAPGTSLYLPTIQSGFEEEILQETGDGVGAESLALSGDGYTLWIADFESKTFPGRVVVSGFAWPAISSLYAHSGRYSAALHIKYANGLQKPEPAVKLTYNARGTVLPTDPKNLPDEAYYSVFYYFPQIVIPDRWWNLMQWKQEVALPGTTPAKYRLYSIHPLYVNGGMSFFLRSGIDENGNHQTTSEYIAGSSAVIPLNEWVSLECLYRWSKLPDGQITCWMNGELLWDVRNIVTELDFPYQQYPRQWTVNNYSDETLPRSHVLFVDDMSVRTQPLGTP